MVADASADAEHPRELAAEAAFSERKLPPLDSSGVRWRPRLDSIPAVKIC
jgi:hypothetical protein